MNFRPETNSLAVHVCRLRAKLASAGVAQVVRTTPAGAYVLGPDTAGAIPLAPDQRGLDAHVRLAAGAGATDGDARADRVRGPRQQA